MTRPLFVLAAFLCLAVTGFNANLANAAVTGDYLEIRSCDVYTGPCFANGEMGLTGREAILAWNISEGSWQGVPLDGLQVLAVVKADATLGDVHRFPRAAESILIVDSSATDKQREALVKLARHMAGGVLGKTVRVESSPIDVSMTAATCHATSCASVRAENLVEIQTRCLGGDDHVCGNEENFYPPLVKVESARPAYTVVGAFRGEGLGVTFDEAGRRSAYLGRFAAEGADSSPQLAAQSAR